MGGWIVLQPKGKLYCKRVCIAEKKAGKIVLQDTQGVLQDSECSGFSCVAIQWDGWAESVLPYTCLYCRLGG